MKKTFLSMAIIVSLLLCAIGIQAQDAGKGLDQLKVAEKYLVGNWQLVDKDTTYVWEAKLDGNVILVTDYIIVNGKKSVDSYWSYSYKPERDNFYIFAANVSGGFRSLIGSFTAENKWSQDFLELFNPEKKYAKVEFVYDTPTSFAFTYFYAEGGIVFEGKVSRIE